MRMSGILGHDASGLIPQWGKTIKLTNTDLLFPFLFTVSSFELSNNSCSLGSHSSHRPHSLPSWTDTKLSWPIVRDTPRSCVQCKATYANAWLAMQGHPRSAYHSLTSNRPVRMLYTTTHRQNIYRISEYFAMRWVYHGWVLLQLSTQVYNWSAKF